MVLEHALGTSDNFFAKIILSFHMPVFFILSGYLAHEKITGDFGTVIKKKVKRLLIPQITLAMLSLLYNFFIGKLVLHTAGPLYIAVTPVAFGYYLAGNLMHKAGTILKDKQIGEKITRKGNIVLLLVAVRL